MQVVTTDLISNKKVLLRYDIDVSLHKVTGGRLEVTEDFRLKAGIHTLAMCLAHAKEVILMGHLGRPQLDANGDPTQEDLSELSVAPIYDWLYHNGFGHALESNKLRLLENLRFESGEEASSLDYAKKLAELGEVYVNEAFASYRPSASTTILPTLLPHAAGLNFAKEVEVLLKLRDTSKKPFVAIMGGAKVQDKLPVIKLLAQKADAVLVGGKLVHEINDQKIDLPENVLVGKLNETGFDIAAETTDSWKNLITEASVILWNGPVGKFEDPANRQSEKIANFILDSHAQCVIGGGDTLSLLGELNMLEKFTQKGFVSSGGGAMLKLISDGNLPTIDALK